MDVLSAKTSIINAIVAFLSQKLLDFSIIRILGKQKIPALAEILVVSLC